MINEHTILWSNALSFKVDVTKFLFHSFSWEYSAGNYPILKGSNYVLLLLHYISLRILKLFLFLRVA